MIDRHSVTNALAASDLAYRDYHHSKANSKTSLDPAYKFLKAIDTPMGLRAKVWMNPNNGKVIVGVRGTSSLKEAKIDIGMNFHKAWDELAEQLDKDFDILVETASIVSVDFTGHSLGGAIADIGARDTKSKFPFLNISNITVGAPLVSSDNFPGIEELHIRREGDVIGALANLSGKNSRNVLTLPKLPQDWTSILSRILPVVGGPLSLAQSIQQNHSLDNYMDIAPVLPQFSNGSIAVDSTSGNNPDPDPVVLQTEDPAASVPVDATVNSDSSKNINANEENVEQQKQDQAVSVENLMQDENMDDVSPAPAPQTQTQIQTEAQAEPQPPAPEPLKLNEGLASILQAAGTGLSKGLDALKDIEKQKDEKNFLDDQRKLFKDLNGEQITPYDGSKLDQLILGSLDQFFDTSHYRKRDFFEPKSGWYDSEHTDSFGNHTYLGDKATDSFKDYYSKNAKTSPIYWMDVQHKDDLINKLIGFGEDYTDARTFIEREVGTKFNPEIAGAYESFKSGMDKGKQIYKLINEKGIDPRGLYNIVA